MGVLKALPDFLVGPIKPALAAPRFANPDPKKSALLGMLAGIFVVPYFF